jgi:hypothetical protein
MGKDKVIMSRFITVNGKKYAAKPFTFNVVCDLEENGVPLQEMSKKPMSMVRAYVAVCFNGDKEKAGEEIENHVKAGGNFNDIYKVMGEEMNDSGFFQALSQTTTEENPEMEMEETKKK